LKGGEEKTRTSDTSRDWIVVRTTTTIFLLGPS